MQGFKSAGFLELDGLEEALPDTQARSRSDAPQAEPDTESGSLNAVTRFSVRCTARAISSKSASRLSVKTQRSSSCAGRDQSRTQPLPAQRASLCACTASLSSG